MVPRKKCFSSLAFNVSRVKYYPPSEHCAHPKNRSSKPIERVLCSRDGLTLAPRTRKQRFADEARRVVCARTHVNVLMAGRCMASLCRLSYSFENYDRFHSSSHIHSSHPLFRCIYVFFVASSSPFRIKSSIAFFFLSIRSDVHSVGCCVALSVYFCSPLPSFCLPVPSLTCSPAHETPPPPHCVLFFTLKREVWKRAATDSQNVCSLVHCTSLTFVFNEMDECDSH